MIAFLSTIGNVDASQTGDLAKIPIESGRELFVNKKDIIFPRISTYKCQEDI